MVEVQTQPPGSKCATASATAVVPIAVGSPSGSVMRRRRRLLSNSSSVMSAAAVGIAADDKLKISNNEAMVHMVKATIGGGFLAMPEAFRNSGWLVGSVGTIIIGLGVLDMMACLVRLSQALRSGKYAYAMMNEQDEQDNKKAANSNSKSGGDDGKQSPEQKRYTNELLLPSMDYPDTVAAVFKYGARGRFARWSKVARQVTSTTLVTTYYGVNIIYVCIVASTCKQLVDQYTAHGAENSWARALHGHSIRWYPAIISLLIIPVGMVRLIKYLVPFSIAANACLVAGASAVFYFIFIGDDLKSLSVEERPKMIIWPVTQWSLFTGSTLCSMEGVGMLLHIENAMRRPLELAGPPSYTLHRSMAIIILLNGALGLFGYLKYGERCLGSISLNLPSNNRLAESIKVMIALGIMLTYGLQLTVTTDLTWQALRSKLKKISMKGTTADNGDSIVDFDDEDEDYSPRMAIYYYIMRFSLILGTIIVATIMPDIGPLVSLVGSVGFSLLGLIVPIVLQTVWNWYPEDDEDESQDRRDDRGAQDNGSGKAQTAVPMTAADTKGSPVLAACADPKKRTRSDLGHNVYRVVRHIKNVLLLVLAVFALIGGAYYNVRDILSQVTSESPAA